MSKTMSKTTGKFRRKPASNKTRWARVAAVWGIALVITLAIIARDDLPRAARDNTALSAVFDWRDTAESKISSAFIKNNAQRSADIEPAAGTSAKQNTGTPVKSGAGYSKEDRAELNELITTGEPAP